MSAAILEEDQVAATEQKTVLEEAQRAATRVRKEVEKEDKNFISRFIITKRAKFNQ